MILVSLHTKSSSMFHAVCLQIVPAKMENPNNEDIEDGNVYLRLRTMSRTIYAAKFEQTIIHQHVHLRRESQSHAPAHVLMRLYPSINRQPMLKLKTHSGFHDLFLKYQMSNTCMSATCIFIARTNLETI
jgi:hypothetical protein